MGLYLLSQNKEKIFNLELQSIEYMDTRSWKKDAEPLHSVCVTYGTTETAAEYGTKEDCLLVIYTIGKAIEQGAKYVEMPSQKEVDEVKEQMQEWAYMEETAKAGAADALKDIVRMWEGMH